MKMQTALPTAESTGNSKNAGFSNEDICDQNINGRSWECGKTAGITLRTRNSQIFNDQQKDLVRLFVQSLRDMGYRESANMLENESGYCLETPSVVEFRQGILSGKWTAVESLIPMMELRSNVDIQTVKFLIRQQKYLELLEARNIKQALHVLQQELTPLGIHPERLHKLSSFMMCSNADDFRAKAEWDGAAGSSRQRLLEELQKCISPSVMVPPQRLETLLSQATTYQRTTCLYHNDMHENISLFQDHVCDRSQFPCTTLFILDAHLDEVWYVVFANSGRHVASASKDKTAIIWSLETMKPLHVLKGHTDPVSFVAWSPDDSHLLTCGNDHTLKLWNTTTGALVQTLKKHTEPVTSCAWLPSGTEFVSGGMDKSVYLWNVDGTVLHKWSGGRVTDLTINKEGTRMVSICSEKKIRIYDLIAKTEAFFIQETDNLTSVSMSKDSRFALINVASQEIHLWNLDERRLVRKYVGQKQGRFVIRSDFGGRNETFIISGSEDFFIYVWQREQATLIEALPGHSGTVNSVSWNPTDPYMFASASDDCTIRIWGVPGTHGDKGKQPV